MIPRSEHVADGSIPDIVREALTRASIGPDRWREARGSRLTPVQRRLYGWLRRRYAAGQRPDLDAVREQAAKLALDLHTALQAMAENDLLTLDRSGGVQHVYPFSAVPTTHEVWLNSAASPVYAMCAVDALGIPYMLGRSAVVLSRDPTTGADIRISVEADGEYRWQPETAVVFVGTGGEDGCIADVCCPVINFFSSRENAESYLRQRPRVQGVLLSVPEAVEAGRIIFGSVLATQPR